MCRTANLVSLVAANDCDQALLADYGIADHHDPVWRRTVADRWVAHTDVPLLDGGVYWQAVGPRFETQAEIRLIAGRIKHVGRQSRQVVLTLDVNEPEADELLHRRHGGA